VQRSLADKSKRDAVWIFSALQVERTRCPLQRVFLFWMTRRFTAPAHKWPYLSRFLALEDFLLQFGNQFSCGRQSKKRTKVGEFRQGGTDKTAMRVGETHRSSAWEKGRQARCIGVRNSE